MEEVGNYFLGKFEQLKEYVDAEFEAAVVRSVLTSKAMKLVRDTAEITEIVAEN